MGDEEEIAELPLERFTRARRPFLDRLAEVSAAVVLALTERSEASAE